MNSNPARPAPPALTRRHRYLLLAASAMTCLLVAMGGIVCATESGTGCPDWPGCYGRIVPPPQINAIIEYTHRVAAALTTPLILASAAVTWRRARRLRWVSWPLALVLIFLVAVIIFGALTVLTGLPRGLAAVDLGAALTVLALVVTATTAAWAPRDPAAPSSVRLSLRSGAARLSLFALVTVFALHVTGVLVAGAGSLTRCLGWPMWRVLPDDLSTSGQVARLALAVVAGAALLALALRAGRGASAARPGAPNPALRSAALAAAAAFLAEMALSALMLTLGTNPYLLVIYVAVATLLWAALVAATVLACVDAARAG